MKKLLKKYYWILVTAAIVLLDQITKYLVVKFIPLGGEVGVIKGFFKLYHVQNTGAGLGLFQNMRWLFMGVTTIALILILFIMFKGYYRSALSDTAFVFILGGGIGNMIDRIFLGYVVDFFQFQIKYFDFIFNVADIFITFGTILLLIYFTFDLYKHKSKKQQDSE